MVFFIGNRLSKATPNRFFFRIYKRVPTQAPPLHLTIVVVCRLYTREMSKVNASVPSVIVRFDLVTVQPPASRNTSIHGTDDLRGICHHSCEPARNRKLLKSTHCTEIQDSQQETTCAGTYFGLPTGCGKLFAVALCSI
jgi:hypothetical protein